MPAWMHRTNKQIRLRGGSDQHPTATWSRFPTLAAAQALQAAPGYFRTVDIVTDEPREYTTVEKDLDTGGCLTQHKLARVRTFQNKTSELRAAGFSFAGKTFSCAEAEVRSRIVGVAEQQGRGDLGVPLTVLDANGLAHTLTTGADVRAWVDACAAFERGIHDGEWPLINDVMSALTLAAVDAVTDTR